MFFIVYKTQKIFHPLHSVNPMGPRHILAYIPAPLCAAIANVLTLRLCHTNIYYTTTGHVAHTRPKLSAQTAKLLLFEESTMLFYIFILVNTLF